MITDWIMVAITFVYVVATVFICYFNYQSAKRKLIDTKNRYTYNSIRKTPKSKTPHHFLSRFSTRKDTKKTPRHEKRPAPCGTDLSNQAVFKPIWLELECFQPSITCRSSASAGQRKPCRDGPRRGPSHARCHGWRPDPVPSPSWPGRSYQR